MNVISDAVVAEAIGDMLRASHLLAPDDLPMLVQKTARTLGALDGVAYLANREQSELVPLSTDGRRSALPIDTTIAGRTFADVQAHQSSTSSGDAVLWCPMLDGTERVGALELTFAADQDVTDPQLQKAAASLATLAAELVVTRSAYGDGLEMPRRRIPMTLPAEMLWTMLPPLTFATEQVVIAGVLSPCHEVAGDTFDYTLNGDTVHLAIFDAMGHGMSATLFASVALGAYRNARRTGLDLVDTARSIDKQLGAQFGADVFVTGILAELNVTNGYYRWVNAGHPPVLLLRGGRVIKDLDQVVSPPLCLLDDKPSVAEERLEPGDRLVFYTDGLVEARDTDGEFFGTDRLAEFIVREESKGRPAPETLRRLNAAVLAHQDGELQDDATVMLVEWRGGNRPGVRS